MTSSRLPRDREERLLAARTLMARFAERTGIATPAESARRYLWTDAFAVCNFLALREVAPECERLALALVEAVHSTLGRHHPDDRRRGWISGLDEATGQRRPTRGGLRIGKPQPERPLGERYEEQREWDRDGQYFHYLTRWMHALARLAAARGDWRPLDQAIDLARAAHTAFVYTSDDDGRRRMHWKMSTDLQRALVPAMGQHDPLDGYVAFAELRAALPREATADQRDFLARAIADMRAMCIGSDLATADALGIGSLLTGTWVLLQLPGAAQPEGQELLGAMLHAARQGLAAFLRHSPLALPSSQRLAFRELGLAIGLRALARMRASGDHGDGQPLGPGMLELLRELAAHEAIADEIEAWWLVPAQRATAAWAAHLDINEVMLATSLAPDGYLSVGPWPMGVAR